MHRGTECTYRFLTKPVDCFGGSLPWHDDRPRLLFESVLLGCRDASDGVIHPQAGPKGHSHGGDCQGNQVQGRLAMMDCGSSQGSRTESELDAAGALDSIERGVCLTEPRNVY